MKINEAQLNKIKQSAQRTLKIVGYIQDGMSPQTIVEKVGCNRQLVDYYIKRLTDNNENN